MRHHLIYLEDDDALASMTTKALQRKNFIVSHARTVSQARKLSQDCVFTHALLDMKLGDGNSISFIPDLASQHPNINIVLLTGYASIATAVQAVKLGAHNYLPKPASINDILSAFEDPAQPSQAKTDDSHEAQMSLKRLEWEKIQQALTLHDGNITLTAEYLNMHRRTLQRKLNKRPVPI